MRYLSTRGEAPILNFEDVVLCGLARDGGLYLPETWPKFSSDEISSFAGLNYPDLFTHVTQPFVGDALSSDVLASMAAEAYAGFDHRAVTPLSQLGKNEFMLELYHGPTLAFKDLAMQFLGRLFEHILTKRGRHMTIVGATSGDTGGAAIEALRGRKSIQTFMLHPKGRVSDVQRRMMTTVADDNIHNIAIEGTFDDCQSIVKALFNDHEFRDEVEMGGVNSINWARVMAQTVYYFASAVALGAPHRKVSFSVPTGNFGDVFAGYAAMRMGLPIEQLIVGTNANDILARALQTGEYRSGEVVATTSPSMDIQVSSNFERLLFEASGRNSQWIRGAMASLSQSGGFTIDQDSLTKMRDSFSAARVNEDQVAETIRTTLAKTGKLIDPHTAVGIAAGDVSRDNTGVPLVALSTAHPAKFPESVETMTGKRPQLPPRFDGLSEKKEHVHDLPNDFSTIRKFIQKRVS